MSAGLYWRGLAVAMLAGVLLGSGASGHGATTTLPSWAKDLDRDLAVVRASHGDHVHPQDTWVILYSEIVIETGAEGLFTLITRKAWQNIGAEEQSLRVNVPFDSATETVTGLTLLKQRGKLWTKSTGRNSSVEVPELNPDYVSADRIKVMNANGVRPGNRVFATWKTTSSEVFPRERILMPFETQPINRFVVRAPDSVLLRAHGQRGAVTGGGYELTGIPAFHRVHHTLEPWHASTLTTMPFLFASLRASEPDWRAAAGRVREMFDAALAQDRQAGGTPAYVRKARELTAGLESVEEKAAALATFAQSLVYRNIEWGVGAYKPEPPSEILRTMSGDCKAKVLLLSAMLETVGVESVPVLARLGEAYLDYDGPPTTGIFNHMVLAVRLSGEFGERARLLSGVGAGWILFDPTDSVAAFGLPPSGLQGTLALWLGDSADRFDIEFAEIADRFHVTLDFDVREADVGEFRMTIDGASAYASAAKHNTGPAGLVPRLRRYAEESLRYRLPGLSLAEVLYDPPDHLRGRAARVTLIGSVPEPAEVLTNRLRVMRAPTALIAHAMGLPQPSVYQPPAGPATGFMADWQSPICCSAEQSWWEARIDLRLPAGWSLAFQPRFAELDNPWISAAVRAEPRAWQVSIRRMRGNFPELPPGRRIADLNRIHGAMQHAFVVRVQND